MIYESDNILAKLINYYGKIVNVFVVVRGDGRSVVACVGLVRWWAQRSWHVSTGPCEVRTPPTIRTHPPGRISLVKDAVGVSSKSLVIY